MARGAVGPSSVAVPRCQALLHRVQPPCGRTRYSQTANLGSLSHQGARSGSAAKAQNNREQALRQQSRCDLQQKMVPARHRRAALHILTMLLGCRIVGHQYSPRLSRPHRKRHDALFVIAAVGRVRDEYIVVWHEARCAVCIKVAPFVNDSLETEGDPALC